MISPLMQKLSIKELENLAHEMRKDIIIMIGKAASGHPGSSLSAIDIITALFFNIMRHDSKNPHWQDRDRFVLSKGHAAPALYAAYERSGYFPYEWIYNLRKLGSPLQGHPDRRKMDFVEASTGSLGQGLSVALGIGLAAKLDKKDYWTYCMIGDGESNEGQIWEAAMFASHQKIDNVTVILDYNKFQLDGAVKDILNMEPMKHKWESFGWHVQEIDGHNMKQIIDSLEQAKKIKNQPTMIIAHTVKGKGVSFMENNNHFHGVAPTPDEMRKALSELGEKSERIEEILKR
ncbi:MAG: transketolase [Chlamydiae bacterium]|nr:transketolase [Chlamydiota bacterium]MBI3276465.1 transketolase [Chlamydiota bacterium]